MSVRLERMLTLIDTLELPPGAKVVDAGCGPAHLAERLAERGHRVVAFDTSRAMVLRARVRLAGHANRCLLHLGSVEGMPHRDASADLVCCAGVLEYLRDDRPALDEIRRVLRPGGHALLSVTNSLSPAGYLDFAIEAAKRMPGLVRLLNRARPRHPVRPRHFHVRGHRPAAFKRSLAAAGLEPVREAAFYLLPWPHPFDRMFPHATTRLNRRLEPLAAGAFAWAAEGHLVLARRRP
jgi:ubiquinone/menaquinone biosynthesis C-methylase UbiE